MNGIELMATAMHAAKRRLDVSASNLANVSSDGFHKRVARVSLGSGGLVVSAAVDRAQGPLQRTDRAFDLAAVGRGGFTVASADGRTSGVRSASFVRDGAGHLVDDRGRKLLGDRGPIVVAADATIDARGIVRTAGAETGRLALAPGDDVRERVPRALERRRRRRDGRRARGAARVRDGAEDARGRSTTTSGRRTSTTSCG